MDATADKYSRCERVGDTTGGMPFGHAGVDESSTVVVGLVRNEPVCAEATKVRRDLGMRMNGNTLFPHLDGRFFVL